MAEGLAARRAALALLGAVLGERRMLSEAEGLTAALPPADRARAGRLAAQVLRHVEPADRVLAPFLRKAPPLALRNTLRLAVVEMAREGTPPHAAVASAVSLVRAADRGGAQAGFANAVLRKVAALSDPFHGLPPQRLPQWLRQPLVHAWGRAAVTAMEAVQAAPAPIDVTLRPGAAPPPGAVQVSGPSWRLPAGAQVTALPGWEAGAMWVQDAAAALPARLLAAAPGARVLDLCAAPGGKTMQLAAAGAAVTALDLPGPRLARLRENLARTGLAAEIVEADALDWTPPVPFAAILLDAPCTATGTIRRHPDLPFVKDGRELDALVTLQAALLDRALGWLAPGGRIVYATCSLLPAEGEAQLAAARARHPGLTVVPPGPELGLPADWIDADGALRLRPDHLAQQGGIDGFYAVCLRHGG